MDVRVPPRSCTGPSGDGRPMVRADELGPMSDVQTKREADGAAPPTAPVKRRPGRPHGSRNRVPAAIPRPGAPRPRAGRDELTIEQIVAVDPARDHRLHPRGTAVSFSAQAARARPLFLLPPPGGRPAPITSSGKGVPDPP